MRALIIGRGSMGRRRIRDLGALGVAVTSWDLSDETGIDEAWASLQHAFVVSTPPRCHAAYAALYKGRPVFTEADVEAFEWPHYPSATPLFTDWYAEISSWAYMVGYVLHVGQHIDDWHPGADAKTYYAYREETGPTREMVPFELIWLTKIFGAVTGAKGYGDKNVSVVVLRHQNALGVIVIDALSRPAIRRFTGVGYGWQRSLDLEYDETVYLREMRAFVAAIGGGSPWPYSQAEEAANLEVLHTIERSA